MPDCTPPGHSINSKHLPLVMIDTTDYEGFCSESLNLFRVIVVSGYLSVQHYLRQVMVFHLGDMSCPV